MDQNLTDHFMQSELGVIGCEDRIVQNAQFICESVLEPIRAHFDSPVRVHDGYRDPAHNARVGGKPASFHLYQDGHCAADIDVLGHGLKEAFDWIRLQSGLGFDKCILEANSSGVPACIHIQVDRLNQPRRQAFVGGIGDSQNYTEVSVA